MKSVLSFWSQARYKGLGRLALSLYLFSVSPPPLFANSLKPTAKWLVGTWGLSEDTCENDNVVVYSKDGTWWTYGAQGTWRLVGNRIESVTLRVGTPDDEHIKTLRKFLRNSETIRATGANTLVSRWKDGSTRNLKRCEL